MNVQILMNGYSAYTSADELSAARGTHDMKAITTTDTSSIYCSVVAGITPGGAATPIRLSAANAAR